MSTRRFRWLRFTIRGVLVLTLCTACYFGGWSAHRRVYERRQQTAVEAVRMAEASVAREALARLAAQPRVANVPLRSRETELMAISTSFPTEPAEKVEGKVLAVDGDYLLVSLGRKDGLERGDTLEVFRLGSSPQTSKYLGRVRVIRVADDESIARVIPELKKGEMKPSDRVANRLE